MQPMLKNMIWIMPAVALAVLLQGRGAAPSQPSVRAAPDFPPLAALVRTTLRPAATRLTAG